jgi:hypothetical protein
MKYYAPATIALMIISIFATTAFAQNDPTVELVNDRGTLCGYLQVGSRIKIKVDPGSEFPAATTGTNKSLKGKLQSCEDGFLTFWADGSSGGLTRVPIANVQAMHFSDGKKGHALLGAGIGLAAGLLMAVATTADEQDNSLEGIGAEALDETSNVGLPVGLALTGALIGALIRTEKWTTVWNEKTLVSSVGIRNGQYLVSVGMDF